MKVAIIGDFHYPTRANELPYDFFEIIRKENPEYVICTGDLGSEITLEELKKLPGKLLIVRGNTDWYEFKKRIILELRNYRILIFHSSEVYPRGDLIQIEDIAREEDCNVVIFGHTHLPLFTYRNGIYFINPGSATGARSGEGIIPPRSFAILEIDKELSVRFFIR